jgi:hypothetical protein
MKRSISMLAALFLLFVGAGRTQADSLVGNFDLDSNLNPITSVGQVTFTLNGDDTIAASLVSYVNPIVGFGFDSVGVNVYETNFSPPVSNAFGWVDAFGYHPSGFLANGNSLTETWTIGHPGDYTSVYQALGGNTATTDFFLIDSVGNQYGAMAQPNTIPEPSAVALLSIACITGLGYFGWRRRPNGIA